MLSLPKLAITHHKIALQAAQLMIEEVRKSNTHQLWSLNVY
jgi:hypothetical protein